MITITDGTNSHVVTPTMFPDGTSQIWKLPEWLFVRDEPITCRWDFESEREIIDLVSVNQLVYFDNLLIPYLPYARQDKPTNNAWTFNLTVLGLLLRTIKTYKVTSYDVHSEIAKKRILDLYAMDVIGFHLDTLLKSNPTYIVFPDAGALARYPYLKARPHIVFEKKRCPDTGAILCHVPVAPLDIKSGDSFLLVDDLCDGGATFIGISKTLHKAKQNIKVDLCVTHGLFSKGRQVLEAAGINEIFTTNSLLRNQDGYKLC